MKERPILFSGPMVQAILAGNKTMTRRVVKLRDPSGTYSCHDDDGWPMTADECGDWHRDRCKFGEVGDRLWVRETWAIRETESQKEFNAAEATIWFRADGERPGVKWKPSIFMPRWASRITLEVTDVTVERLQNISEADAKAEGICLLPPLPPRPRPHVMYFKKLWESINGEGSWDANPWVWAVSFKRI